MELESRVDERVERAAVALRRLLLVAPAARRRRTLAAAAASHVLLAPLQRRVANNLRHVKRCGDVRRPGRDARAQRLVDVHVVVRHPPADQWRRRRAHHEELARHARRQLLLRVG